MILTSLGRCLSHVSNWHMPLKTNTNVTEQLTSNSVLAKIFLTLWTLNPGTASLCSTVSITYMHLCVS